MVIDTSAIVAILLDEPERKQLARLILSGPVRMMSAVSKLEAGMVAVGRGGVDYQSRLQRILRELEVTIIPFDEGQADIAREAFGRFGKGRHPAGLNFGDCASYALAVSEGEPLLFKGADFSATDVEIVKVA